MVNRALQELRAARAKGGSRLHTFEVAGSSKVYDELDEEDYKKVVRKRLDEDDFVVDDNGAGYADDGREEWMHEPQEEDVSDEEAPRGKAGKRKREEDAEKAHQTKQNISKFFNKKPATTKPKPVAKAEDNDFMNALLTEIDVNIGPRMPSQAVKTEARRKTRVLSPPIARKPSPPVQSGRKIRVGSPSPEDIQLPNTPPTDDVPMFAEDDPLPSSPVVNTKSDVKNELDSDEDDFDLMDVAQTIASTKVEDAHSVNISGSKPKPPAYPTPESSSPTRPAPEEVDSSTWSDVTSKLNVVQATEHQSFGKVNLPNATEPEGHINFFWIDYTEINGSLCLFGKVRERTSNQFVSAFVKVDNILRKLYFLPRDYRNRSGRETDEEVEMNDVYQEADALLSRMAVGMHKMKPCTRKYAFELPDVPKEADYLKALYSYDKPALPNGLSGETFSYLFGATTALFEQFVLWKQIMGPCWLKLDADSFSPLHSASWCKLEMQVTNPKLINPLRESDTLETPPLNMMSLAFRTTLNVKENKQEILMASARIYENLSLSDTSAPEKLPCRTYTVMRPAEQSFPIGFDAICRKQRGEVALEKTENALLSRFLAIIQRADPDVLMGHQLQDVHYPVFLSRLREKKITNWHSIGRMRRSEWPKNFGKGNGSFFSERQLIAGRLLCDIGNDMGKSLMTKCQSWSLTEMCDLYLPDGTSRLEIDNDDALKTWAKSREGLANYMSHCEADTYFVAAIALRVQIMPLSKVLTNLAGNSWARTLSGTRAERNEYILLHEFHKNKYICPDKVYGKSKSQAEDPVDGEEGVDVKKKDKFKGGLVFEPEKGLYDKFILVMDFNSLYPSIIQEFNICFTTVQRTQDEEKVPDVPVESNQGILPRLIATLVSRRRQVKALMKDRKATAEQLATWDIKQLALKLTANSMYGCLGYVQSRFYARPLAMLTTFKGREILQSTKELAEGDQLQVIYGDTDSVMINTNASSIDEAFKIGHDFKRSVNERYKLLEIDIDNVFRRLLLHAKKKYAAINLVEIDGKYVDKLEVKGLDMKRREYCALAKEASSSLLSLILSGDEAEMVVQKVHEYLRDLAQQMREEKVAAQKYIIFTKLGKNPKDYPNADSMPQVQVALRALSQGKTVRQNDVVSYITTAVSESNNESVAKRAFAPADVLTSKSTLKPDVEWYLSKQIFPPIERLCAPMPGTDSMHLADCLGLDVRKYNLSTAERSDPGLQISPLESQIPDSVRFAACSKLSLRCRRCHSGTLMEGLVVSVESVGAQGLQCSCGLAFSTLSIVAQLEHAIRVHTSRYYDAFLVCDDASCGNRTRQMSVYGKRCLGPLGQARGCRGYMRYEYSDKELYNQLLYYRSLFDVDMSVGTLEPRQLEKVNAAREFNRERFHTCKSVVDAYLAKCGHVWVQMDTLFAFMGQRQSSLIKA